MALDFSFSDLKRTRQEAAQAGLEEEGFAGFLSGLQTGTNQYFRQFGFLRRPKLKQTAPPRGAALRNRDPFDFFGTLFTTPATSGLNPINTLNQMTV